MDHPYKVFKLNGIDPNYSNAHTADQAVADLARFLRPGNTAEGFSNIVRNCFMRMRWNDRDTILAGLKAKQLDLCKTLSPGDDDIELCLRGLANPVLEEKELLKQILSANHTPECKAFAVEECLLTKTKQQMRKFNQTECGERWNESVLSDLECMWSESNPHLVSVVRRLLEGSDEPFEAEESYIVDGRDWRKAYEACSLLDPDCNENSRKRRSLFLNQMFYVHIDSKIIDQTDPDFYLMMQIKMILFHFEIDFKSINKCKGRFNADNPEPVPADLAFNSKLENTVLKDILLFSLGVKELK